jgi:CHAT domain-containing protein
LHDRRWEERATAELAIIAFLDGDVAKATGMIKSAIVALLVAGDPAGAIYYGSIVGNGLVEVGQPEAGLRLCNKALLITAVTPDIGFPFWAYEGKGRALVALRREAEAKQVLNEALGLARARGARLSEAELLIVLGKDAASENRAEAIQDLKLATDFCQANGFVHAFAWSAFELAKVYRDVGDYADAEHYARATVEPMQEVEDKYHLPQHLSLLADLEVKRGNLKDADNFYAQAEDVTEGMLINTPSRQVESSLIATTSETYVGHFAVAERQNDARKAFGIVELARGRSIADSLRSGGDRNAANDPTILTAQEKVNRLQAELIHATSGNERSKLLDDLVTTEFYLAPTGMPVTRFQEAALRARPPDLDEVRKSLGTDETILEYVLGPSESFCLYITRTDAAVLELTATRDQIERLARQFVDQIESKRPATGNGRQLCDLLVAPLPSRTLKRRLIIVPDGELHLLPWDALVDKEGRYMLVSHVVTTAPSAMVLCLIRTTRPQKRSPLTLLAVGDVQYQRGVLTVRQLNGEQPGDLDGDGLYDLAGHPLQNLPNTHDEVIEAGEALGGKSVELLGPDATETAFKKEPLGQFRIIHIAAHGIASAQFPDRAALVLGEDSTKRDDGLLQAREIRNLHLNADLVTLSACDTGTGRLQGEEGIASLERAFFYAGARSVLASLWTTSDVYTTTLMRHFYHHLGEGQDEGRALQQAKLELIQQFRDQAAPLFWAGFTLVGETSRPITTVQY